MAIIQIKNNYDYMISLLPWHLSRNKNIQNFYKVITSLFDEFDRIIKSLDKMWLIDYATGEFLDDLGAFVETIRIEKEDDGRYRARIKLEFKRYNFVPHLNKILELCKDYTGIYPKITEGWNNPEHYEPARYDVDFIANSDFNFDIIDDLDLQNIVGAGVKINGRKCVDNYSVGFYAGEFFSGQTNTQTAIKHNPICDFVYKVSPISNTFIADDRVFLTTKNRLMSKTNLTRRSNN